MEKRRGTLGRESQLLVVSSYLFDPMINEANESSSACHFQGHLQVETSAPPIPVGPEYRTLIRETGDRRLTRRLSFGLGVWSSWAERVHPARPTDAAGHAIERGWRKRADSSLGTLIWARRSLAPPVTRTIR